jgi:predicted transcriptional regulator
MIDFFSIVGKVQKNKADDHKLDYEAIKSRQGFLQAFIICFRQTDRFKAIKSSLNIFFWKHNRTVTTLFVKYHKLVKIKFAITCRRFEIFCRVLQLS